MLVRFRTRPSAAGEDPDGSPVEDDSDDPDDATDVDPDGDGEPDDPTVTPLSQVAELQVSKVDTLNGTGVAGDTIDYGITVTNTGTVTVSDIDVLDSLADVDGSLVCLPVEPFTLGPSESALCGGSHTVIQAEVDAGSVSNVAAATGEDPSGGPVTDDSDDPDDATDVDPDGDGEPDDPTVTPLDQVAELQVSKVDVLNGSGVAGDTIDYGITVTNTGTVTVSDIDLSDSLVDVDGSLVCLPVEPFDLAPGESALCGGTHTVTQAEVDSGSVSNVATATGEDPDGGPVTDDSDDPDDPTDDDPDGDGEPDDPTVTPLTRSPELQVVKTDVLNGFGVVGDTIDYAITVTNTGTVTVSDIDMTDSLADAEASLSCTPAEPFTLAPGASASCTATHTIVQAEVDAGSVSNTATATGEDPDGDPVADDSDDPDDATDDDPDGDGEPDDPTVTPLTGLTELEVIKTDTLSGTGIAGDTVDYGITVTNTGTVTVTVIDVTDSLADVEGSLTCTPSEPFTLLPGASASCSGSHTVTQAEVDAGSVSNTATATGQSPDGDPVADDSDDPDDPTDDDPDGDGEPDDPTLTPLNQVTELEVSKVDTLNGSGVAGDTIDYGIAVTNTGTVTMSDVSVSDSLADVDGSLVCLPVEPFDLAPGESALCGGTHTVTQPEVDSGSVSNTATASGEDPDGDPVSDDSDDPDDPTDVDPDGDGEPDDPTVTPLSQAAELQVSKVDTLAGTGVAGDTITYGVTVTNTGTVTVSDIGVSDSLADAEASLSCTPAEPFTLAPGASASCTAAHTVTQSEVDAGSVSNTATATGEDPDGDPVADDSDDPDDPTDVDPDGDGEPDDPTVTPLDRSPELQVVKTDVLNGSGVVGDTVDYAITVVNTGTVTVSAIDMADSLADAEASLSCTPGEPFTLAPGASASCTAAHTVTQAEVDAGSVSNTATATGQDPDGAAVSDDSDDPDDPADDDPDGDGEPDDPTATPLSGLTGLEVIKTDTLSGTGIAGDTITYAINMVNTGAVTISDVTVSDSLADVDTSLSCVPAAPFQLVPGATASCTGTHTVTQADVDAGLVTNVATATGEDPDGDPVADDSDDPDDVTDVDPDGDGEPDDPTVTPLSQVAELQVTKTDALSGSGVAGDTITYAIGVVNTGTVTLSNVTVADSLADADTSLSCAPGEPFGLAPGASAACTATHTVTQAEVDAGSVTNVAIATGEDPDGAPVGDASDDPDDPTDDDPDGDGEPDDPTVTPLSSLAELQVTKVDTLTGTGLAGDGIAYAITVTNTGTVTVSNISVSDALADVDASLSCIPIESFVLLPGASASCVGTHTVTQAEVDAGSVSNTATATGESPGGAPVVDDSDDPDNPTDDDPDGDGEPDDPTITPLTSVTELQLTKTDVLTGTGVAGDTIAYTITAINTGTTTLSDLTVADPNADPGSLDCSPTALPATLAPGASFGCSATHTVTQADVDRGSVSNTATVTGEDPIGDPVVDDSDDPDDPTNDDPDGDGEPDDPTVTPLDQRSELQVTKTDLLSGAGVAGDTITYTITVANIGSVTVTDIDVTDPNADTGSLNCSPTALPASLAPGASFLCTATRTVTQADVDAGSVANVATAAGRDPGGAPVTDDSDDPDDPTDADPDGDGEPDDPTVTPLSQVPELQVTKVDTLAGVGASGDVVTYALTIINTGTVTVYDIDVDDPIADVGSISCSPVVPFTLAPGASASCTATHTVTQTEADAGSVTNQATATGQDPGGTPVTDDSDDPDDPTDDDPDGDGEPDDPTVTPLSPSVGLEVIKSDLLAGSGVAGDTVTYSLTVTNTGLVTLSDVTVSDTLSDADTSLVCAPAEPFVLAVGASASCAATHTVTQAEVDAGSVVNTATATAEDPGGNPVSDDSDDPDDPTDVDPDGDGEPDDPTVTPLNRSPELQVSKVDTLPADLGVGNAITYAITVVNTGSVTVDTFVLADPNADPGSIDCGPSGPPASLAPGGSFSCTAAHTITQADVDAREVVNTVTVSGDDPGGTPVTDDSDDPDDPTNDDPDGDGEPDDPTVSDLSQPPIAVDDTVISPTTATPTSPTVVDVVANDRDPDGTVDPTTVSIVGGTDTDGDGFGDELVVPGEGTWTVDATNGEVTFTPESGFEEDPTPITYTIDDDDGLTSPPATVTILYPPPPTTVVGVLWIDTDDDGVQDPGEAGIPGVTVVLTCSGPDGELGTDDDTVRTTVTESPYGFDGVPIGAVCTVTIDETTLPPDLAQTVDPDDILDAATSFTVTGPTTGVDFGFRAAASAPAPPAPVPDPDPDPGPRSRSAVGRQPTVATRLHRVGRSPPRRRRRRARRPRPRADARNPASASRPDGLVVIPNARWRGRLVIAVVLAATLAACSDGDEGSSTAPRTGWRPPPSRPPHRSTPCHRSRPPPMSHRSRPSRSRIPCSRSSANATT